MKRKEFTGLKNKSIKDLEKLVREKKEESLKKKMEGISGKDKNLKNYRNLRREIAQALTLIKEKQIIEELKSKSEEVKTK
ncbi:MAG: 50S ribosomal protein L29 [Candidatus Woesebacteria bacterium]|nr:MAG: 50S ribosomal protein L29 [Candidatus Woesebacteria bacterium]